MNSGPWKYLALASQIGFVIAWPAVILAGTGAFLDRKYNTKPYFLLTGILLAFIVSTITMYAQVKKILRALEKEEQERKASNEKSSKTPPNNH